ncbi:unnamed protein product [Chironomus riparius]|uniref:Uncharacterized protein n=1 Tax=Chironomus riparius TaxID=315576 RepID=A0A9N9RQH1_9DIPT|nr:unnamed protein product [Chironomus riparius]
MSVSFRKCLLEPKLFKNLAKSTSIASSKFTTHQSNQRQVPKCTYVLSPTQWLKNKINFQILKLHDKDFNEKEFTAGAKQAALVILEIARTRNAAQLARVSTLRGFSRIFKDMLASKDDPRRKLLYFNSQDIQKIITTDVQIAESDVKFLCLIEVFFVCVKYLDDVIKMYEVSNPNVSLKIYQDIKEVEKLLKKKNYTEKSQVPTEEKLLVTEGYFHLCTSFPKQQQLDEDENEWKIDHFKISEFNIVRFKDSFGK